MGNFISSLFSVSEPEINELKQLTYLKLNSDKETYDFYISRRQFELEQEESRKAREYIENLVTIENI